MYFDTGICVRTACLSLSISPSMTHQETQLAPKTGERVGSLEVTSMNDLQGCQTGREKTDLNRYETYIFRFFFPLHFFLLFQSKASESFILKTIKRSLSVHHLADNAWKNTKNTFHFQLKFFNVLNNIDPFTTQICSRIIVSNPPFLLMSDVNLTKTKYDVWVGDLERLSQIVLQVGVVWSCRQCLRTFMLPSVLLQVYRARSTRWECLCIYIAQFSIVLINPSGNSGVLTVPAHSHHIRDKTLSARLPVTVSSFPLPEVCQVHPGLH